MRRFLIFERLSIIWFLSCARFVVIYFLYYCFVGEVVCVTRAHSEQIVFRESNFIPDF